MIAHWLVNDGLPLSQGHACVKSAAALRVTWPHDSLSRTQDPEKSL